jgi:hypothetical protein
MEFKRVWMSYKVEQELSNSSGMIVVSYSPVDNDETEAADQEISDLLNEGWKIVSTCPVTGSINILNRDGEDVYVTFTKGIEVFIVKE